jgi:hypothetical protein
MPIAERDPSPTATNAPQWNKTIEIRDFAHSQVVDGCYSSTDTYRALERLCHSRQCNCYQLQTRNLLT